MALMTRLLNSISVDEHNYVSPYKNFRDVCLSGNIKDIYYLEKSHKCLCIYENYISLSNTEWLYPHQINLSVVWIKSVEGVKKIIPLSVKVIICIYEDYISILNGLKCSEHKLCVKSFITDAFVYKDKSLNNRHIKLGVLSREPESINTFDTYELFYVIKRKDVEVGESIPHYFFNLLTDDQISKLISLIPEPILHIEIIEYVTCLFTPNFMWLIGSNKKLNKYKHIYTQFEVINNVIVLFKPLD